MSDEMGERSEQPTAKRLSDARSKGQIPRSQDLGAAAGLLVGIITLVAFGGTTMQSLARVMDRILSDATPGSPLDETSIIPAVEYVAIESAKILAPLLIIAALGAYITQYAQVGWIITAEPIRPKLSKLDPIKGTKKLFNKRNLVKTVVNTLKLLVVILVSWLVIMGRIETLVAAMQLDAAPALLLVVRVVLELAIWLVLLLLTIAVIDYTYQRWQHTQDLKMTKQQVKDERRSMEGDPEVKGRRLKMAREIAMQRIANAVPQADVIVTNPEHFSVAIKYEQDGTGAPRVIAKGADHLALRIRQLARLAHVPIVERPPLARALYWGIEVGQEIAPEHYQAVAEILAYVYRMNEETPAARTA